MYLENATHPGVELPAYAEAYVDLQVRILRFLANAKQAPDNTSSRVNTSADLKLVTHLRQEIERLLQFEVDFSLVSRQMMAVTVSLVLLSNEAICSQLRTD